MSYKTWILDEFKQTWREIRIWFFVRNIGREWKQYNAIDDDRDRLEFLAEHFGKLATDVLDEIEFRKYLAAKNAN